jgi:hypothetical protein
MMFLQSAFANLFLQATQQTSIQVSIDFYPLISFYPLTHLISEKGERELQKLENELEDRKMLYQRAQPVFDKLNEWFECWKEKLDMQRKVCRASFYKNRGGTLNTKLKVYFLLILYTCIINHVNCCQIDSHHFRSKSKSIKSSHASLASCRKLSTTTFKLMDSRKSWLKACAPIHTCNRLWNVATKIAICNEPPRFIVYRLYFI